MQAQIPLGNAAEWMALSIEDGSTLSTHSLHAGAFVEKDEKYDEAKS